VVQWAIYRPVQRLYFDVVVSTESFHWFPDPDAALAESRRVLPPVASSWWV